MACHIEDFVAIHKVSYNICDMALDAEVIKINLSTQSYKIQKQFQNVM